MSHEFKVDDFACPVLGGRAMVTIDELVHTSSQTGLEDMRLPVDGKCDSLRECGICAPGTSIPRWQDCAHPTLRRIGRH
jgi:hypothetical protein